MNNAYDIHQRQIDVLIEEQDLLKNILYDAWQTLTEEQIALYNEEILDITHAIQVLESKKQTS